MENGMEKLDKVFRSFLGGGIEKVGADVEANKIPPFNFWTYRRETAEETFLREMGMKLKGRTRIIIDYDEKEDTVLARQEIVPVDVKGAAQEQS